MDSLNLLLYLLCMLCLTGICVSVPLSVLLFWIYLFPHLLCFACTCIFGFKGGSTSKVIGARNEMMMDYYDGQMIFGDLVGLKPPDIRLTGEEKPKKNLTQEICPDRGSNPGPLRDKRACYHLFHSSGLFCLCSFTLVCNGLHVSPMYHFPHSHGML